MKLLAVVCLAAVALARIPSSSWETEQFPTAREIQTESFKRGSEFLFRYEGQVASGIPGSSPQHSATRIQALVALAIKGEQKAILKIQQIRMGKLNQDVWNPRAMIPFMAFQEVEIQEEARKELSLPVQFSYAQGLVSQLVFDQQEKPWSANIKRGILNLLQVNLAKRGQIKVASEAHLLNRMPQAPEDSQADFFATQEKTVQGECETLYTVVSEPAKRSQQPVLNVTRSVEFENCKERPEIKYNFRFQDPCQTCEPKFQEDQKFLKSSSVAKFNISGTPEEFLIESAILESQYQMVPLGRQGNVISTYVNQTLTLLKAGPIRSNIRGPKNPVQSDSGLVYSQQWDAEMEEFLMKGHEQARLPVQIKDRVKIIAEVLRPLVAQMRDCVAQDAPVHYAQLVKILRFSQKDQLPAIFAHFVHAQPESFSTEEHQKIKAVLVDALADAGSKDSISFLLDLIKERKISPLQAAITIKHLNNVRTPSKEMVREVLAFLDSPVVKKNFVLKQAAYLSLGSLVQGLCMPSEERLAILPRPSNDKVPNRRGPSPHLCPQQLQDTLLEKLFKMAEKQNNVEEQVLALKTIGNMGIPKSVTKLEKMIRQTEQKEKKIVRIEAIMALRQLREALPQKVQQILMPVFMNRQEPNEIRMAAVHQIFETVPARPVLDQIARKLFAERSHQVAAFVFTYMQTMANSSNPCELRFARDLQLSLRHGRQIAKAFMPHYSKALHLSAWDSKNRLGVDGSLISIISNRTFVPKYLGFSLHTSALGFWSKYLVAGGIGQENVESLFARVLRRTEWNDVSLEQILARGPRAAAQASSLKELKKIWTKLSTVARRVQDTPIGMAHLRLKDQEFFMLPITAQSLDQLPSLQSIRKQLTQGSHFNLHKAGNLHEMEYKIPTSIGMPLVVSVKAPIVAQLSGQVRVETQNPFKLILNQIKPAAAAAIITSVNIWNPVVANGLKVVAAAKVCTPISAEAELNIKNKKPELKVSMEPRQKATEWIRLETRPMTFTRVYRFPLTSYPKAQHKTILGEQWERQNNVRDIQGIQQAEQMVQKVIGLQVSVDGLWHHTPRNAPANLPVCPFSGPNHVSVKTEGTAQTPERIQAKITLEKMMEKSSQGLQSQSINIDDEEINGENFESQTSFTSQIKAVLSTQGGQQQRRAEMVAKLQMTPNLRIIKTETVAQLEPIPQVGLSQPVQFCTEAQIQFPSPAQNFQQVQGKSVQASAKATWGQSRCQEQNKVEVSINAKHSQQQEMQMEEEPESAWFSECDESPERCSPLNLQGPMEKAQELLQYNIQARFNNLSPMAKNVSAKALRALQTLFYWNSQAINFNVQNPAGLVRAQITIDPKTKQLFNATIKTPVENVTITDAPLPMPMMGNPMNIRRLPQEIQEPADLLENAMDSVLPVCRLNSRRIQTFDGASFRAPLSTCWTLLAKDCDEPEAPLYAVLAKKVSAQSQQKAVKVVARGKVVVVAPESSAYDSLKVKINGKAVPLNKLPQSGSQVQFEQVGEALRIELPQAGIRVTTDGYTVKVQASPLSMAAQCGVCGHYDGELESEFWTPQGQETSDLRHFIRSHTMKEAKCGFPASLEDIDSQEDLDFEPEFLARQRYTDSDEDEQSIIEANEELFQDSERQEEIQPVSRVQAEEDMGQICFSTESVPVCPRDSFPAEYEEEERQVSFKCLSRSSRQGHRAVQALRRQDSARVPAPIQQAIQELSESYSAPIPVPTLCQRA